ncbi:MAG: ABC transporter permease [Cyclobacteriaceae bacterium]
MLRNYLMTALRSLSRHRFFSFINIFGLSISMTICMGIIMLVADQLTYDMFNTKGDRIYRVISRPLGRDGIERGGNEYATSPLPMAPALTEGYTGIEQAVRIKRGFGNDWIEFDQNVNIPLSGFFADPGVLQLFEYELEYGDARTALKDPYSVVLTRRAADKLFKEENPLGLTVKVGEIGTYTVTGVIKATDRKSHIVFEALASMSSTESLEAAGLLRDDLNNWRNHWNAWTYVLLEEGKKPSDIQPFLDDLFQKHVASIDNPDVIKFNYHLQALDDITPGPFMNNAIGPFLPWLFIYFLGGLAGLIMLTSCFNFTNLSIARSLTRAKEIGIRKVSGAARWQVFLQFLSEAVITSLFALAVSFLLLQALKPAMLSLNFARLLKWDLEANMYVYGVFVLFAILVGILAGFFPATVLSGFQPVKVLKNLSGMKLFSRMGLRKVLLVSQFTLSLVFILSVIVLYNQLQLFVRADHGFEMENHLIVPLGDTKSDQLKTELQKYSNVLNVSAASHIPAAGTTYGNGFKKSLDEKDWTNLDYFSVDEDYISNIQVELVAGRNFTTEAGASNANFIVINEEAVKALHYNNAMEAIGQQIIFQRDSTKKEIIGVVKDYNHQMLMAKLEPMALMYNPTEFNLLQVRYEGEMDDAKRAIEQAWSAVNPSLKVDIKIFADEIHAIYNMMFGDIVKVVGVIAGLAIFISCLGLLGMATYNTETRIKEISIRKVLGSSNQSLVVLLSRGFLGVLLISILIAVPLAYFVNNLWLELIAYHTTVSLSVIAVGILFLLVFGVITIGSQTLRATFVNPVDNLKNE